MVDWHSPAQIARDSRELFFSTLPDTANSLKIDVEAFSNLIHIVFGLYLYVTSDQSCRIDVLIVLSSWEFCVSFNFDYSFISGKRKYRWPLVSRLVSS